MRKYLLLFISIVLSGCSQQPKPIHYGSEACSGCKMTIMDKKFGAEIISGRGKIYKFDDLICMVEFLKADAISENEISRKLVIDYEKQNNFLDAAQATYYVSDELHSPMNGNAAAFVSMQDAKKFHNGKQGAIMQWNEVYNKLK